MSFCPNCGTELEKSDNFCQSCGKSLAVETKKADETQKSKRPISITIAAIMSAFYGGIEILLGLLVLGIGLLAPEIIMPMAKLGFGIIALVSITGLWILIFGIIDVAVAYGLWKLKKWAGILGIILNVGGFLLLLLIIGLGILVVPWVRVFLGGLIIILIVLGWNNLD